MDRKPLASEEKQRSKEIVCNDKLLSVPDVASWILGVNSTLSLIDIKTLTQII